MNKVGYGILALSFAGVAYGIYNGYD